MLGSCEISPRPRPIAQHTRGLWSTVTGLSTATILVRTLNSGIYCIVLTHRCLGSDCTTNAQYLRDKLEDLFIEYQVDLVFAAHKHSKHIYLESNKSNAHLGYERLYQVYDNKLVSTNYTNPQ
jgi:hypothetical protein